MNIWLQVLPLNWETDWWSVGAFQECRLLRRLKSDGPLSARLETLIIRSKHIGKVHIALYETFKDTFYCILN